jgi:hypothetical protein
MVSWLNMSIATPVVGIQVLPDMRVAYSYPQLSASYFNSVIQELRSQELSHRYTFSDNTVSGGFIFTTSTGFSYTLKHDSINASYTYSHVENRTPDGWINYEPPEVKLYTELLSETIKRMKALLSVFTEEHKLQVVRIGIVANIQLIKDSAPPGIQLWIDHLGKPWEGKLNNCQTSLLVDLGQKGAVSTRCLHSMSFDFTSQPDEIKLTLDWQRIYEPCLWTGRSNLDFPLEEIKKEALEYFELFGIGQLNYD